MSVLSEQIDAVATRQHNLHKDKPEDAIGHSVEQRRIGVAGEFAFGEWCGIYPDTSDKRHGDGGKDFTLPLLFTVDVKTSPRPDNLLVEQGMIRADIYVLAEYDNASGKAALLGWTWAGNVRLAPVEKSKYGKLNHTIPRGNLRDMAELASMMGQWQRGRK